MIKYSKYLFLTTVKLYFFSRKTRIVWELFTTILPPGNSFWYLLNIVKQNYAIINLKIQNSNSCIINLPNINILKIYKMLTFNGKDPLVIIYFTIRTGISWWIRFSIVNRSLTKWLSWNAWEAGGSWLSWNIYKMKCSN